LGTAAEADALDDGSCTIEASPRVDSWVAYFGTFDMRLEAPYSVPTRRVVDAFLGAGDAGLASPITHVDADDPPALIVHGSDDIVLQVGQARAMVSALRAVAAPVTYIELEGVGHGFGLLTRAPEKRPVTCTLLTHLGVLRSE
ncbi:MAG: alpha/beta hydrolase fold domain-containing protein, partial [Deltaproteobacteria bacterium]|nr:alpha/beta hydrolase fold domain-containing protein [Deltaproteobacteria bacterium]